MTMSQASRFMLCLSRDVQDSRNRLSILKDEAIATCTLAKWAGLVQMMALSSVVRREVFSVYPDTAHGIRPLFHGLILPRETSARDGTLSVNDSSTTPIIMWSRDGALDNTPGVSFQPNHFVPLSHESSLPYLDDDFPMLGRFSPTSFPSTNCISPKAPPKPWWRETLSASSWSSVVSSKSPLASSSSLPQKKKRSLSQLHLFQYQCKKIVH